MPDLVRSQVRLNVPQTGLTSGHVRRHRLDELLSQATRGPVTVVKAEAGSGKTSAVASWTTGGERETPLVAWLTMDRTDNDLPRFWSDIIDALVLSGALPTGSPLSDLVPSPRFGSAELLRVRDGLWQLPAAVVLVLDDFQEVTDAAVLESLDELLEHQPANIRFVFSTRTDPPLHLDRHRRSGCYVEIGADDLAFNAAEAAELFDRSGIQVSQTQVGLLLDRTSGWSAGLRMVALSLESTDIERGIARFAGAEGPIADYLIGEVTDRLSAGDRDFLLRTSVADRLSGELATVLSDRVDGSMILDKIVGANAFVVRFGGQGEWFGYHPLFRQMLQELLAQERPEIVRELHRRAARWFQANGEPIEGIRHAVIAQDWDEVARMLTASSTVMLTPDAPALVAILEPVALRVREDPSLTSLLAAAVCHYHRQDFEAMLRDAELAARLLPEVPDDIRPGAAALIAVARMTFARARVISTLVPAAGALLALADAGPPGSLPGDRQYRAVATNNLGLGQLWVGDLVDAESKLTTALAQSRVLGLGLAALNSEGHLALLDVIRGRLRAGYQRSTEVLRSLDRRGWGSEIQAVAVYVTLSLTRLAWNQPDEAAVLIRRGLTASRRGTDAACRIGLRIASVGVELACGTAHSVQDAAAMLHTESQAAGELPDLLARWCAVTAAEAHLAVDAPVSAIGCIAPTGDDDSLAASMERVILAKAHLALGRPDMALDLVEPLLAPKVAYLAQAVDARVLAAVVGVQQGRTAAAVDVFAEAVDLAQPQGLLRPFVWPGSPVAALIDVHRVEAARHLDFVRRISSSIAAPQA